MAPGHSAERLSPVPKARRLCLTEEQVCGMSFFQVGVTELLAVRSMSMDQQCILNKVFLNRNT